MVQSGMKTKKEERVRVREKGWGEVGSNIVKPLKTLKPTLDFSGCTQSHTFPLSKFQRGAQTGNANTGAEQRCEQVLNRYK